MSLVPTQQRRWKDALYETSLHSVAETVKDEKASMVGAGGWGAVGGDQGPPSRGHAETGRACCYLEACWHENKKERPCSVMSDSLQPHGL